MIVFAVYCVVATMAIAVAIVGAMVAVQGPLYVTLDCRDGQHGACDVCACVCHPIAANLAAGAAR